MQTLEEKLKMILEYHQGFEATRNDKYEFVHINRPQSIGIHYSSIESVKEYDKALIIRTNSCEIILFKELTSANVTIIH